ncbi:hypothetical protein BDZ89DRAFT_1138128 [Hymenopellis radicata]|nr:hypothetical protein BDZ89DRAFT_1138128 [Hymenopellis radicata]
MNAFTVRVILIFFALVALGHAAPGAKLLMRTKRMSDESNCIEIGQVDLITVQGSNGVWIRSRGTDCQNMFRHFDSERSGSITGHDLVAALRSLGYTLSPHLLHLVERKYGLSSNGVRVANVPDDDKMNHLTRSGKVHDYCGPIPRLDDPTAIHRLPVRGRLSLIVGLCDDTRPVRLLYSLCIAANFPMSFRHDGLAVSFVVQCKLYQRSCESVHVEDSAARHEPGSGSLASALEPTALSRSPSKSTEKALKQPPLIKSNVDKARELEAVAKPKKEEEILRLSLKLSGKKTLPKFKNDDKHHHHDHHSHQHSPLLPPPPPPPSVPDHARHARRA